MTILTQYYEERGQLVAEARDLLNKAEAETDTTKATELEQRHDEVMGKVDTLDAKIKREERQAQVEREEEERRDRHRPEGHPVIVTGGARSHSQIRWLPMKHSVFLSTLLW